MARDPVDTEAAALRAQALEALRGDDLDTARALLEAAVGRDSRDVAAWTNYGGVLGELGRSQEARQALETARRLDPLALEPLGNLGVIAREDGRLTEAEDLFREILVRAPGNLAARYNLAHTLFLSGRFDDAAAEYREGLRLDPEKTPNQNARLAWALAAAGQTDKAGHELRRALERMPAGEGAAVLEEAAEVLRAIAAIGPGVAASVLKLSGIVRRWARTQGLPSPTIPAEVAPDK